MYKITAVESLACLNIVCLHGLTGNVLLSRYVDLQLDKLVDMVRET